MATSCICIVLCSLQALQPDTLHSRMVFQSQHCLLPAGGPWARPLNAQFLISTDGGALATPILRFYKLHALTKLDNIYAKASKTMKCYTNVCHYYFSNEICNIKYKWDPDLQQQYTSVAMPQIHLLECLSVSSWQCQLFCLSVYF